MGEVSVAAVFGEATGVPGRSFPRILMGFHFHRLLPEKLSAVITPLPKNSSHVSGGTNV